MKIGCNLWLFEKHHSSCRDMAFGAKHGIGAFGIGTIRSFAISFSLVNAFAD
jgi:hypothetical protein